MKKVVVTGAEGMLGSEVVRHLRRRRDVTVVPTSFVDLDITDLAAVKRCFERERPSHIVHCAAFTLVDTAEKEPLKAFMVNAEGTKNLAFFAAEYGAEMLYISTDYVFSGDTGQGYVETDPPKPINVYGESKLRGEEYLRTLLERHKVVRTSWLNGLGGASTRNFIETMLRISEHRSQLHVVNDQTGRPTFTFDLAAAIVNLLDVKAYGVFHVTGEGTCTWYDFARRIFDFARRKVEIQAVTSSQFRSLADRPKYSVLLNTRFEDLGIPLLPDWEQSLADYFRRRRLAESVSRPESRAPSVDARRAG